MTKIVPAISSKNKKKKGKNAGANKNDVWIEIGIGAELPPISRLVPGLFRVITTLEGENGNQFVCCRYVHGNPVFGCAWNDNGKVGASFPVGGREFRSNTNGSVVGFLIISASRFLGPSPTKRWRRRWVHI